MTTTNHPTIRYAKAVPSKAVCAYCKKPDLRWNADDLQLGKRGMKPGPGVEYHCMRAFYGAQ